MNDITCLCVIGILVIVILVWIIANQEKPNNKESTIHSNSNVHSSNQRINTQSSFLTNERFVEVSHGTQVNVPRVTISYSFENSSVQFINDSRKYHGIDGKSVQPAPFMQYWPTFQAFNKDQEKWYFYWRSEVRKGHYLKTDLSYIFVFVYELLCLVEITDYTKAAEQIKTIWKMYRSQYPKLDKYLPDWGGDLITTQGNIIQGIAWWWEMIIKERIHPPEAIVNIIIQKAIEARKTHEIPYVIWASLNTYKPQNMFYQRYNQNSLIDKSYLKAIYLVDNYLSSDKNSKGILERYTPSKLHSQTKMAFLSAIVPESYPKHIIFGEAQNFTSSSSLGNLLVSITKYTENILRKQNHFAARLSGFKLDKNIQRLLDESFIIIEVKKTEAPIRITLDMKRVDALISESEQVSEILESEASNPTKPLYSDIVQVQSLWEKLDLSARRLLVSTYRQQVGKDSCEKIDGLLDSNLVLIKYINQLSISLLGDQILSINNNKLIIADDFMDEMELIEKDNPFESIPEKLSLQPPSKELDPIHKYLSQLSPEDYELLLLIVTKGPLAEADIEAHARTHGKMGTIIIDSISEKAIDQLGQSLFYRENSHWFVEEEYLNMLREIIWREGA